MDDLDRFLHNSRVALDVEDHRAIAALRLEATELLMRRDLGTDPRRRRVIAQYHALVEADRVERCPTCGRRLVSADDGDNPAGECAGCHSAAIVR